MGVSQGECLLIARLEGRKWGGEKVGKCWRLIACLKEEKGLLHTSRKETGRREGWEVLVANCTPGGGERANFVL